MELLTKANVVSNLENGFLLIIWAFICISENWMPKKNNKFFLNSYIRLSAIFTGFFLGNLDKIIDYILINNSLWIIIFKALLFYIWLWLWIGIILKNRAQSNEKIKIGKIFRWKVWFNHCLIIIITCFVFMMICLDIVCQSKKNICFKQEQTIENQNLCIKWVQKDRFKILKILRDE